jgi:urease accessory protein
MSMVMSMRTTTRMGTISLTSDALSAGQLQRLQTWFSAGFPIGAFSYSHGLEAAFEAGLVKDRTALADWVDGLLLFGSARNDAILFAEAHRQFPDSAGIAEVANLARALSSSAELRAETLYQGTAFLRAIRAGWPDLAIPIDPATWEPVAYPVAAGVACAAASIPLRAALLAYLHGFAANIVSAALRSMPIGQSDGLAAQAGLEPAIALTADQALAATLDELGSATPMLDWLSAAHESQYSRLFRS